MFHIGIVDHRAVGLLRSIACIQRSNGFIELPHKRVLRLQAFSFHGKRHGISLLLRFNRIPQLFARRLNGLAFFRLQPFPGGF